MNHGLELVSPRILTGELDSILNPLVNDLFILNPIEKLVILDPMKLGREHRRTIVIKFWGKGNQAPRVESRDRCEVYLTRLDLVECSGWSMLLSP